MELRLRELRPSDRAALLAILQATAVFRPEEIEVALELVDHALAKPGQKDYLFAVAEHEGRVAGYACWGATPGTRGTWDLYWIATDPALHGRGIGGRLMAAAEEAMRSAGGRLCVVETSSLPAYEKTRRFYLGAGYALAARLSDYYAEGDDLCIFTRRLTGG